MANNKYIIHTGKEDEKNKKKISQQDLPDNQVEKGNTGVSPSTTDVPEENIWGNDSHFNKLLSSELAAERRFYARVRYMQKIECSLICESANHEVEVLSSPINFTMFDLSIGGVGILCEKELKEGTILIFKVKLDDFTYEVKYQVIYCMKVDNMYRMGLKLKEKNKEYLNHLKVVVARITLQSQYGE